MDDDGSGMEGAVLGATIAGVAGDLDVSLALEDPFLADLADVLVVLDCAGAFFPFWARGLEELTLPLSSSSSSSPSERRLLSKYRGPITTL